MRQIHEAVLYIIGSDFVLLLFVLDGEKSKE